MLLKVEDLTVSFGNDRALDGVSFSIAPGQRFGLIGESGSGKTMSALAIMGLLPEGARLHGSLAFEDKPMPADDAERARLRGRRIGMVFQEPMTSLDPLQKAGAQVAEAIALAGGGSDLRREVEQLFGEVGLDPGHADRYPHELSGGQRQRVLIAMALAGKPDLLIADEPTSALDLITQRKVIDLIDRLCAERNMALLFITHDLKAVAALCTTIMVIRDGKVVEAGDKTEVFGRPQHEYTRRLIAAARHRTPTLMRTPIGETLLELRKVTRRFRQPDVSLFQPRPPLLALEEVSFSIRAGESVALVGPSGSGKSTLARIVAGLDRASRGELEFAHAVYHGSDLPGRLRGGISLVFQDPFSSFNPRLTIGDSIAEPLRLEPQTPIEELGQRMAEMVRAVGLSPDMLERYPHEFSGGQRQRFAIARALVTRPRLVVLDEPVSALDVSVRNEVLVLLNRLRADFGLTFLVISHDLEMVELIADRVLVIDHGRIVETGTPQQLFTSPREKLTRELIASALPELGGGSDERTRPPARSQTPSQPQTLPQDDPSE